MLASSGTRLGQSNGRNQLMTLRSGVRKCAMCVVEFGLEGVDLVAGLRALATANRQQGHKKPGRIETR